MAAVGVRRLGREGLEVSAIALGCMSMSEFYGAPPDAATALATFDAALELGVNTVDTSDSYGPATNEELVGRALAGRREAFVVCTKFGIIRTPGGGHVGYDGTPRHAREACEASLRRLRTDHIDLYYLHRVDPRVPIEETVGAMAALVKEGKVRFLGLSEVNEPTLRRAHAVHAISAVQCEFSLWARDAETALRATLEELGIGMVAYSPLGRGFLAGRIRSHNDLEPGDFRRSVPRFQGKNLDRNLALLRPIEAMAAAKGCTPAQLVLAWLLHEHLWLVPLPGCRRPEHIRENAAAVGVRLNPAEAGELSAAVSPATAAGSRRSEYDPATQL
jgi:aryl-alcohol dehydrogenase-like predicted oxidoreductase